MTATKKPEFQDLLPDVSAADATFEVTSPYDGRVVGIVRDQSADEVRGLIEKAEAAFSDFRKTTAKQRGQMLGDAARLMHERKDDFAPVLTAECGKPLAEARGEWDYAIAFVEWFAGQAERIVGDVLQPSVAGKRWMSVREPAGVAAVMGPWNFPVAMLAKKIPAALAAGCTVLARSSSRTPLSSMLFCELLHEAGFGEDVVTAVTTKSAGAFADPIFESSAVRVVSFTGSTPVGRQMMQRAADTMKHLGLELGGHAPFIVFADADIEAAVAGLFASKFRNAGQTCICPNRVFVHRDVYDDFAGRVAERAAAMTFGDPMDGVDLGPMIDRDGYDKAVAHINDAMEKGAKLLAGGIREEGEGEFGLFVPATVLGDVSDGAILCREETFGPVVPLLPFDDEADVLARANDSDYGLAGYFYTRDLNRALRVAGELEAGVIGINDGGPGKPEAPFGGVKQSGLGREGGPEGLDEYLHTKFISIGDVGA